jgi:hypothetical protein
MLIISCQVPIHRNPDVPDDRLPESWNYLCHQGFVDIRNSKTSKWVIDVLTHVKRKIGLFPEFVAGLKGKQSSVELYNSEVLWRNKSYLQAFESL